MIVTLALATGCGSPTGSSVSLPSATSLGSTSRPEDETSGPPTGPGPEGFELALVTFTRGEDAPIEYVMWFAGTPEQRTRGLTDITDLGQADGMLFVFDQPARYHFYMWQTPMPLDILFFDAGGRFVGRADMEPCLDGPAARCERYSPDGPFLSAVEFPDGALDDVHVDDDTRIAFESRLAPNETTVPA